MKNINKFFIEKYNVLKKIYLFIFVFIVITFIIFLIIMLPRGILITYEKNQNTNTVIEMLRYASPDFHVKDNAHIVSVEYTSYWHDFKLRVKYLEDNIENECELIIDGNNKVKNYFVNNGTDIQSTFVKPIIKIYKFIFIFILMIGIFFMVYYYNYVRCNK